MATPDESLEQKVSKWQLREQWNEPLFQAAMRKRCTQQVIVREELAPPEAQQQPGALSQVYDLYDNTVEDGFLGTFHCYKNLDGSLGASGKADPMWLRVGEVLWYDP